MSKWIGVDLDGTLAEYDQWVDPLVIGKPIPLMVERVKAWLVAGKEVRIFTARVGTQKDDRIIPDVIKAIENWCLEHIGQVLPVTNLKDFGLTELWDDRAIRVEKNTGIVLERKYEELYKQSVAAEKVAQSNYDALSSEFEELRKTTEMLRTKIQYGAIYSK